MVDKTVLVGLTTLGPDDELLEQRQLTGRIASADAHRGVELILADESSYWLPPDVLGHQGCPVARLRSDRQRPQGILHTSGANVTR